MTVSANLIVLGLEHAGQSPIYRDVVSWANVGFTVLFAAEAALKIAGLGFMQYVRSGWNSLDGSLVLAGFLSIAISEGPVGTVLKLLRVGRIMRIVRFQPGLLRLMTAFIACLPAFINVVFFLFAVLFFFAVVGMNLFSGMRGGTQGFMSVDANFETFFITLAMLFRAMTGENYNGIMHELMLRPPFCIPEGALDAGGNVIEDFTCSRDWVTVGYWVIFFTTTNLMLLNIITAVAMEAFDASGDAEKEDGDDDEEEEEGEEDHELEDGSGEEGAAKKKKRAPPPVRLTKAIMNEYLALWNVRDQEGTQFLPIESVCEVIAELSYPFGVVGDPVLVETADLSVRRRIAESRRRDREAARTARSEHEAELVKRADELRGKWKKLRGKPGANEAATVLALAEQELAEYRKVMRAAEAKERGDTGLEEEEANGGKPLTPLQVKALAEKRLKAEAELESLAAQIKNEDDARAAAMNEELLVRLSAIQARSVFGKLPLVASNGGRFHFHAVLHALMERASEGNPLGVRVGSLQVAGKTAVASTQGALSMRALNVIRRVQLRVRREYRAKMAKFAQDDKNRSSYEREKSGLAKGRAHGSLAAAAAALDAAGGDEHDGATSDGGSVASTTETEDTVVEAKRARATEEDEDEEEEEREDEAGEEDEDESAAAGSVAPSEQSGDSKEEPEHPPHPALVAGKPAAAAASTSAPLQRHPAAAAAADEEEDGEDEEAESADGSESEEAPTRPRY